ncbi:MAG: hypothetical protein PSX36_08915 [bacterium]|nr:hypothetical protein [bacterium]
MAQSHDNPAFKTGTELLAVLHQKFYQGPCRTYTFSQHNTHYKADTVSGHSEWKEAISFPDKFRIDVGEKGDGNYVVFRNDSAFNFKGGKVVKARVDSNSLLLILGGMYYRNLEDVKVRLHQADYAFEQLSAQHWNGAEVLVMGALENDLSSNQIWIDKATLRVLRILEKINEKEMMDMRFESHQKWCKGFVETKVSFRRNGKLEQVEEYYDITPVLKFPN